MTRYGYYPEGSFPGVVPDSMEELERARREGRILQARAIICDTHQNLIIELGANMRGIIKRGEFTAQDSGVKDIAVISRVNRDVCFVIMGFETDESGACVAQLSRREAQARALSHIESNVLPGDVLHARVTHLEQFGAFVDIGCGIISLINIENISVSRISHPRERFTAGQDIYVAVRSIDSDNHRVNVTHKELLGTWEQNASGFTPGETVLGVVRSVEEYGIFIELTPNLAGLAEYRGDVMPGQKVAVYIKSIIPDRMKVKLVIIDIFEKVSTPSLIQYYVQGGNISRWRYTPYECHRKLIETVFE